MYRDGVPCLRTAVSTVLSAEGSLIARGSRIMEFSVTATLRVTGQLARSRMIVLHGTRVTKHAPCARDVAEAGMRLLISG